MTDFHNTAVEGLQLGVRVAGEGLPVLILHGWGGSSASVWPIAEGLAQRGFQAHALDLPGFGTSQRPPEPWDVPRYADFVLAYMEKEGLDTVRLIGHSFGGRISIVLGAEHPERAEKIVLVNSAGVLPTPTLTSRLYMLARGVANAALNLPLIRGAEPAIRARLRRRFGSEDYLNAGELEETFKRVIGQDLVPYARRIKAPTLLIWGDQDKDTPLSSAKVLEAAIPDAGLVVFTGAGHYSYLDRPEEFIRVVTHFLRGS